MVKLSNSKIAGATGAYHCITSMTAAAEALVVTRSCSGEKAFVDSCSDTVAVFFNWALR